MMAFSSLVQYLIMSMISENAHSFAERKDKNCGYEAEINKYERYRTKMNVFQRYKLKIASEILLFGF